MNVRRQVAMVTVGLFAGAVGWPATADAHSGVAVFQTLEAEGGSDLIIDLRVRVRYSEDNELAERAFLSATPTSPRGRKLPEIDLEREAKGVYGGAIQVDDRGKWTIAISSAFPPGSTSISVDVGNDDDVGQRFAVLGGGAVFVAFLLLVWRRRRT